MFGKKKKNTGNDSNGKTVAETSKKSKDKKTDKVKEKKKKNFSIRKLIILGVILGVFAGGGFFAYKKFLTPHNKNIKIYTPIKFKYISLPNEILKFTFNYLPGLYTSFINFDRETFLVDQEIERIKKIAKRYPLDKNIADKEMRIWVKARDKVIKNFKKIQDKTEAIYVLFQVNKKQGIEQINAEKQDIEANAKESLTPLTNLTKTIEVQHTEKIPKGFIKGIIYKLRKKIG